jgi:hypothetical protein
MQHSGQPAARLLLDGFLFARAVRPSVVLTQAGCRLNILTRPPLPPLPKGGNARPSGLAWRSPSLRAVEYGSLAAAVCCRLAVPETNSRKQWNVWNVCKNGSNFDGLGVQCMERRVHPLIGGALLRTPMLAASATWPTLPASASFVNHPKLTMHSERRRAK